MFKQKLVKVAVKRVLNRFKDEKKKIAKIFIRFLRNIE